MGAEAFYSVVEGVPRLEGELRCIVAVSLACPQPAFLRDDDSYRLLDDLGFQDSLFGRFDERTAIITKGFRISLDFLDHQALERGGTIQKFLQFFLFLALALEFLLNPYPFQPGQLPQTHF